MSLATLSGSTKKKQVINKKEELLVYGYIRMVGIKDKIIPSSIINLCLHFYHSKTKIIFIKQNSPPIIILNELDIDKN